jgi:hypothetical protein
MRHTGATTHLGLRITMPDAKQNIIVAQYSEDRSAPLQNDGYREEFAAFRGGTRDQQNRLSLATSTCNCPSVAGGLTYNR